VKLLAIDPGSEESALLLYSVREARPLMWAKLPNTEALEWMDETLAEAASYSPPRRLAIEMVASYGMAVGVTTFETAVWAGRFIERWSLRSGDWPVHEIYRRNVKLHICGTSKAKDANVRQALIDRFGGKQKAIGLKKTPGPLYGLKSDCWAALAVAITVAEGNKL
jgi:hypothetical protein